MQRPAASTESRGDFGLVERASSSSLRNSLPRIRGLHYFLGYPPGKTCRYQSFDAVFVSLGYIFWLSEWQVRLPLPQSGSPTMKSTGVQRNWSQQIFLTLLRGSRTAVLLRAGAFIAAIAVLDWRFDVNISFGQAC